MQSRRVLATLLLCSVMATFGCSDEDDPVTPPVPGMITIEPLPDTLNAPWTLHGPAGFLAAGTGYLQLDSRDPGDYTITWEQVEHCDRPNPHTITQTLQSDGTLSFVGIYDPEPGSIILDPRVASIAIDAPWQITGPDGFNESGLGHTVLSDVAIGSYTITWESYGYGVQTPDPTSQSAILAPGGVITFNADYGTLNFESPDGVMQLFQAFYDRRHLAGYAGILSQDYLWIPQGDEAIWTYDEEIGAVDKMFNGLAGEGGIIISSISVDQLEPQGTWQPTPTNDPNFGGFPGSQYRNYLVDFSFSISGQNLIYRVQGPVVFYTMSELVEGGAWYRILGMIDSTFGAKATENHSWTGVKGLFL